MKVQVKHTLLSLLQLKGIGPALIHKHEQLIKEAVDGGESFPSLLKALGKNEYTATAIKEAEGRAADIIDLAAGSDITIIDLFDSAYPLRLKANGIKWPILYGKGKLELEQRTVGIIGSREATEIGLQIAQRLGTYFSAQGCRIVNGIAKGIDAASISKPDTRSHALGVAPGGLAFSTSKMLSGEYLEEAQKLLEAGGGLISPYPPDKRQDRYTVVEYCKLQAALSDALILVQSRVGGGSRFTIEAFSRLPRPLGIVNASRYDQGNADCYSANDLLLQKGRAGLSEYGEIAEEKINCSMIEIVDRSDYSRILDALSATKKQEGLFDK